MYPEFDRNCLERPNRRNVAGKAQAGNSKRKSAVKIDSSSKLPIRMAPSPRLTGERWRRKSIRVCRLAECLTKVSGRPRSD